MFLRLLLREREFVVLGRITAAQAAGAAARDAEDRRLGNISAPARGTPYTCPCCGHPTLPERGAYDWCDECGWEDDGQDDHDSSVVRGGPNGPVSLDDERAAYVAEGGVRGNHVPPGPPS